jgi:hypothetical protein
MIRFFSKRDILSHFGQPVLCCRSQRFLFDEKIHFRHRKARNHCTAREILFDGYLMGSILAVQKDTRLQSFPTHEKARNLGRSQAFLSPPSCYAAVQWFGQTLVDVSRLRKTFFSSFLFDGKPSGPATKPKNDCATKEILFDGYLMARLKHLSWRPDLFLPATFSELIGKLSPFSAAVSTLSLILSDPPSHHVPSIH